MLGTGEQIAAFRTLEGLSVRKRAIRVEGIHDNSDLGQCTLIYLTDDYASLRGALLSRTRGQSVLTIGETSGFARDGGMIGLVFVGKKLRFEINLTAAKAGDLEISSQLLGLAKDIYR